MSKLKTRNIERKLYTASEIADMYSFSVDKVYRMGADGTLRTVRFGKSIRFYPMEGAE